MMESDDCDHGNSGQHPHERHFALRHDAEKRRCQHEQHEVENVKHVQTGGIHQLFGGERLHADRGPLVDLLAVELSASH